MNAQQVDHPTTGRLTKKEAAAQLGMTVRNLQRLIAARQIECYRVPARYGGKTLIDENELLRFKELRRIGIKTGVRLNSDNISVAKMVESLIAKQDRQQETLEAIEMHLAKIAKFIARNGVQS